MSRRAVIASFPAADAEVQDSNIVFEDGPVPTPGEGEVLIRHTYLSVDPTHRIYLTGKVSYFPAFKVGDTIPAVVAGVVEASNSADFKIGEEVVTFSHWGTHSVAPAAKVTRVPAGQPIEQTLTLFHVIIGLTAWVGVNIADVIKPISGPRHAFVVSGAAGAVGSIAGQLAKARGAYVIGIAGGPEKVAHLRALGFDAAIDYKAHRTPEELQAAVAEAAAPAGGVDSYFDNVGGEISAAVLENFKIGGRLVLCGAISSYNSTDDRGRVSFPAWSSILFKSATVHGFICVNFLDEAPRAFAELAGFAASGKLRVPLLDIADGLTSVTSQLRKLTAGTNTGKTVVKL